MKTLKWSLLLVPVIGVSISMINLRTRSQNPLITVANEPNQTVSRETVAGARQVGFAWLQRNRGNRFASRNRDQAEAVSDVMRIRADRVLAMVNERPIWLNDLVALRPDEQELALTGEEYQSRLIRAVEMELTLQAAAAQGVELTPEQKKRVAAIAQKHEATLRNYQKQGITWSSVTPAKVEFEQRLTSALLLQQNLVAIETGIAPSSDPIVQGLYEEGRSEILSRWKANSNISISTTEI